MALHSGPPDSGPPDSGHPDSGHPGLPDSGPRTDTIEVDGLARALDRPMGALGLIFLFVVLGQNLARDAWLVTTLSGLGWLLWGVFVAEFALRAFRAQDNRRFWRRNWWQVLFLVVPFLRFARALTLLRAARVGGVVSAAVRGSRSAGRLLSGRVGWLVTVTGVVVLAASQLLYVLGAYDGYTDALHDTAMSTVTGAPLSAQGAPARFLEVALAVYSVAVFASLAGAFGAYFLQRPQPDGTTPPVHAGR
jgi:voltage-gated potassium channel